MLLLGALITACYPDTKIVGLLVILCRIPPSLLSINQLKAENDQLKKALEGVVEEDKTCLRAVVKGYGCRDQSFDAGRDKCRDGACPA